MKLFDSLFDKKAPLISVIFFMMTAFMLGMQIQEARIKSAIAQTRECIAGWTSAKDTYNSQKPIYLNSDGTPVKWCDGSLNTDVPCYLRYERTEKSK